MIKINILHANLDTGIAAIFKTHLGLMLREGVLVIVDNVWDSNVVFVLHSVNLACDNEAWDNLQDALRLKQTGKRIIPIRIGHVECLPDGLKGMMGMPKYRKPIRIGHIEKDFPDSVAVIVESEPQWAALAAEVRSLCLLLEEKRELMP